MLPMSLTNHNHLSYVTFPLQEPFGAEMLVIDYPAPPLVVSRARPPLSAKPIAVRPLNKTSGGCEAGFCACNALDNPTEPGPSKPGPSKPGPSKPGPSKPGPSKAGPSKPGPSKQNWRLANQVSCVKKRQPEELTEDDVATEEKMRAALKKLDEQAMLKHFKKVSDEEYSTGTTKGRLSNVLKRIQEQDYADMGDDPNLETRAIVLKSAGKSSLLCHFASFCIV